MSIALDDFGMIAPSSGGGGGGGSMNFYKCSAVDTTSHTWSGYLASIDPVTGVWSFAATATTGLEYDHFTPLVGMVYDAGCTFRVTNYYTGIPQDAIIHVPLHRREANAATGQSLTYFGESDYYEFTTWKGIDCVHFYGLSWGEGTFHYVGLDDSRLPTGRSDRTVSAWVYADVNLNPDEYAGGDAVVAWDRSVLFAKDTISFYNVPWYYGAATASGYLDAWHHVCAMSSATTGTRIYVDGNLEAYNIETPADTPSTSAFRIGDLPQYGYGTDHTFYGYIAGVRVFDRLLNEGEIQALASELHPTS